MCVEFVYRIRNTLTHRHDEDRICEYVIWINTMNDMNVWLYSYYCTVLLRRHTNTHKTHSSCNAEAITHCTHAQDLSIWFVYRSDTYAYTFLYQLNIHTHLYIRCVHAYSQRKPYAQFERVFVVQNAVFVVPNKMKLHIIIIIMCLAHRQKWW